jgi:hypothetical protein
MVSLSIIIEAENTSDAYDRVVPAVGAGLKAISGSVGYVTASVVEYTDEEENTP